MTIQIFSNYYYIVHRLYLAALHYNENKSRDQAKTKCGSDRYSISYPKYKKGGHVVRKIYAACTYSKC